MTKTKFEKKLNFFSWFCFSFKGDGQKSDVRDQLDLSALPIIEFLWKLACDIGLTIGRFSASFGILGLFSGGVVAWPFFGVTSKLRLFFWLNKGLVTKVHMKLPKNGHAMTPPEKGPRIPKLALNLPIVRPISHANFHKNSIMGSAERSSRSLTSDFFSEKKTKFFFLLQRGWPKIGR